MNVCWKQLLLGGGLMRLWEQQERQQTWTRGGNGADVIGNYLKEQRQRQNFITWSNLKSDWQCVMGLIRHIPGPFFSVIGKDRKRGNVWAGHTGLYMHTETDAPVMADPWQRVLLCLFARLPTAGVPRPSPLIDFVRMPEVQRVLNHCAGPNLTVCSVMFN